MHKRLAAGFCEAGLRAPPLPPANNHLLPLFVCCSNCQGGFKRFGRTQRTVIISGPPGVGEGAFGRRARGGGRAGIEMARSTGGGALVRLDT